MVYFLYHLFLNLISLYSVSNEVIIMKMLVKSNQNIMLMNVNFYNKVKLIIH
jgi:hypothetical protein